MRLALYEPDIPQNCGTLIRLAACLGVGLDIIEPCGFVLDDKRLRRAGMDYLDAADVRRHSSWRAFCQVPRQRVILLTTKAQTAYTDFCFRAEDTLLLGRESAGVPDPVHRQVDARIIVPLQPGLRSLNIAVAAGMVLGEALRQTKAFAPLQPAPPHAPESD